MLSIILNYAEEECDLLLKCCGTKVDAINKELQDLKFGQGLYYVEIIDVSRYDSDVFKIRAIKALRDVTSYGLKEAKSLVDNISPHYMLCGNLDLRDAANLILELKDCGIVATITC